MPSRVTKDHDVIRAWAEARGATPSHVKRTGSTEDVGVLRFDFPGYSGEDTLEPVTWEQFLEKLDERDLVLLYEEETSGGQKSNFNKIVSSETAAGVAQPAKRGQTRSGSRKGPGVTAAGRTRRTAAKKKSAATAKKSAGTAKRAAVASGSRTAKKGTKASSRPAAKKSASRRPIKKAAKKAASKSTSARSFAKKTSAKKTSAKKSARGRRR